MWSRYARASRLRQVVVGISFAGSISTKKSDIENQREFMDRICSKLGITSLEDFYLLKRSDIEKQGGRVLFGKGDSLIDILQRVYPEKKWNICQFKQFPKDFWKSMSNQKLFLDHLAQKLHLKYPRDWCNVKYKDVHANGGAALLIKYSNTQNILKTHFPEHPWDEWFAKESPSTPVSSQSLSKRDFWRKIENQRFFMDNLFQKLNLKTMYDWTQVDKNTIIRHGGRNLFSHYNSYFEALQSIYPDYEWNISDMKTVPHHFWAKKENHKLILDAVAKKLNLSSPKEFVSVSKQEILENGGKSLFKHYSSLYEAVVSIYPEYNWNIFDFKPLPRNIWDDKDVQRKFLDQFARENNIKTKDDWKQITSREIHNAGGVSLLQKYPSMIEMLSTLYPEFYWDVFERNVVPRNFWDSKENIQIFLRRVQTKYAIKQDSDWERISKKQITVIGGGGLLHKYKTIFNVLKIAFPEKQWNIANLHSKRKRSSQRYLFLQVKRLFHQDEVIEEYIHEELSRKSGFCVEFDIFIPKYQIGIEYHGEHHYKELPSFGSIDLYQKRDLERENICKNENIHLVIIPYWFSVEINSLQEELKRQLPPILHPLFDSGKE